MKIYKHFLMSAMLLLATAMFAQNSGNTGSLSWVYTSADSTLTISGSGFMPDYGNGTAPWYHLRSVKYVNIETGITTIGNWAFSDFISLTKVTLPNSVTVIGDMGFAGCTSLTKVTLPNSLTKIGDEAFTNCSSLTVITLPNSITTIGEFAFYRCTSLTELNIGNSLATIGMVAFGLTSLTKVTNQTVSPQTINNDVFDEVNQSACTLYVPAASMTLYQEADVWKDFISVEEFVSVTGVTLETELSLNEDEDETVTATLIATVLPANATIQAVTFSSSDNTVATVNETTGLVTAVAAGTATITVTTTDGGFTATCTVTVIGASGITDILAKNISIYPNSVQNELNIESGELRIEKIEIMDLSGKTVSTFNYSENKVNVSTLPSGIYFIKIETDKGVVTEKFVKE